MKLPTLLLVCSWAGLTAFKTSATEFIYSNFNNVSNLTRNGSAAVTQTADGMVMRLVKAQAGQSGNFFITQLINASTFSATFKFRITNPGGGIPNIGADGIAFVIQSVTNVIGYAGGGIGYAGMLKSMDVEFDTWHNPEFNDPNDNHIGINTNGNNVHGAGYPYTFTPAARFDNGNLWYAWVDYDGTNVEVRANETGIRPAAPSVSRPVNLVGILGKTNAYVGLTSATGSQWENVDVVSFYYRDNYHPIIIPRPDFAEMTVTVDPTQTWLGFINCYNITNKNLECEEVVATDELSAYFFPSQVSATKAVLSINTSTWDATGAQVYNYPDGTPRRFVQPVFYIDVGTNYGGTKVTFNGTVESNSLPAGWVAEAFILELAVCNVTNCDVFVGQNTAPLVTGTPFSVSRSIQPGNFTHYGFYIYGPNTAPGSPDSTKTVSILVGNAPYLTRTFKVDPTKNWLAYLNYFNMSGAYLGSVPNTLAKNPATFIPSQNLDATRLLLGINTDTYAPGTVWNDAGGNPLRRLEPDCYIDLSADYGGAILAFQGVVESNSLPAGWNAYAFIKEFTPGFASLVSLVTTPLVPGVFSISRPISVGNLSQYGFYVYGPNTAPGSPAAQQKVSIFTASVPQLTTVRSGANVILTWPASAAWFTLQSAPSLIGTFTNVPGATSPYTNPIPGGQQYFRLMHP